MDHIGMDVHKQGKPAARALATRCLGQAQVLIRLMSAVVEG